MPVRSLSSIRIVITIRYSRCSIARSSTASWTSATARCGWWSRNRIRCATRFEIHRRGERRIGASPRSDRCLRLLVPLATRRNEKLEGPIVIAAAVPGTGDSSDANGNLNFIPRIANQRYGLALNNGVVYVAFASHGDIGPYHGWILGYDASTLEQVSA